jgi:hypothetical protein
LLVYDSYIGGFIVTFSYIHVLYPKLVYPLHYSPSYTILLLKVTSTGFNCSCSYLYRKYINHIHPPLLGFSIGLSLIELGML